jgi:hypothetical protein
MPSRGDVCLLFGLFGLVHLSFFEVCACFLVYWLNLLEKQEGAHSLLLMSFAENFFNRLIRSATSFWPPRNAGQAKHTMHLDQPISRRRTGRASH